MLSLVSDIRHLNPLNKHLERTTKVDKDMVNDLDYGGIESPLSKKNWDWAQFKRFNNICINVCCYENDLTYPVYVSNKKFDNCMNLLLKADKNKSHYVCIKY